MNNTYYQAIDSMEKSGVSREYILGWASGFLHNPKLEEQRVTDAYEAGYSDGEEQNAGNYQSWVGK